MYIIADSQQYYDIPDMSGTVNGTLEKGDEVQVKGICNENGWYQVSVYYQKIYEYIPAEALSATRPEISFTEIEPTKMWLIKDAVLREYPSDTAKSIKEITWVPTGAQVLLIGTSTESEYCKVDYYGYTGYILVETLTDTIPEDAFPYELLTLYSDETGIYYYRRIARYKTEEELAKETELNQEATHLIGDIGWEKLQELDKTSIYYGVRQSQPISYPGLTVYKMIAYYHFNEEVKFSTEEEELVQTAMSNQKSVDIRKTSGIITYENKRYVEESMFQEYYASLDLSKKTVNLNILKDNEGTAKNFRDCFGFDYNTCDNAFELFTTCKEAEGYEPDLKAYTMDNTSFYGWSEYIYRFKEGNALIEEMTQVLNEWYGSEAVTDNSIYFERNEAGLIIGFCAKVYIEVDNKMYMYYRDIDFGYPIS